MKSYWYGVTEVRAATRSQTFSEPISRNVGTCDNRSASFTSS